MAGNRTLLRTAVCLFSMVAACTVSTGEKGEPIARVYDRYLYKSDLERVTRSADSREDSLTIAHNFIRKWVKEQVLLVQAELNIPDEEKNFSEQMENYRNSLLIYTYETRLLEQKLDTQVTSLEIENYYQSHLDNFQLGDMAVRVRYVKTDSADQINSDITRLIRSNLPGDLDELKSICLNHAEEYYFDDLRWHWLRDVKQNIPMDDALEARLESDKTYLVNQDGAAYILYISDVKRKGENIPLPLVEDQIQRQIVNQKKVELIKRMRNELYNDALNNKNAEILVETTTPVSGADARRDSVRSE